MTTAYQKKVCYTDFSVIHSLCQNDGTALSGTSTETNIMVIDGIPWEHYNIGTVTAPAWTRTGCTVGVDVKGDDQNAEGFMAVPYGFTSTNPLMFTIGTSPAFYAKLKVAVTDWSGCLLMFGFNGGATFPAYTATWADYTDKACIGNNAGGALDVYTHTALNAGADVATDTTINLVDADVATFTVKVSAAGVVTYAMLVGSTAQTLTTVAYTFDTGDYVVPFLYVLTHTDTATLLNLQHFECGYQ